MTFAHSAASRRLAVAWRLCRAAIMCALFVSAPMSAGAATHTAKLDTHVKQQAKRGSGTVRVIVRTKPGQRAAVANRLRQGGHNVYGDHAGIEALSVEVSANGLKGLANDPSVDSISSDADIDSLDSKKNSPPTSSSSSSTTSTYTTVTSTLLSTLDLGNFGLGSTIGVAVLDSGLKDDGNFTGRILEFDDFTTSTPRINTTPYDDFGHGSHVAGLIGSNGSISLGKYSGVAQGTKFLILKVLDKNGSGKTSTLINAIEYVIANKDRLGIRIINLSLGHPIYESAATDPLVLEVERATRAGLIVVVAAGNIGRNPSTGAIGYAGITSPGNAPDAITVGAAKTFDTIGRSDDRVAGYSSRGPTWYDGFAKPDIVAPGQSLISDAPAASTLALTYPSLVVNYNLHTYLNLSGTSMSTGVVSGLVAAMLEVSRYGAIQRATTLYGGKYVNSGSFVPPPYPSTNAVKAMLEYSATRLRDEYGVEYDSLTQGAGEVNGIGALLLAYYADTSQPVGSKWITTPIDPNTLYGTENVPWVQDIIWGTNVVSGSALIDVNQQAWAQNVVWGTGDEDNIIWGTNDENDNIVWGTSADQDNIIWGTDVDNIVWGTSDLDNIIWGTDVIWGTNVAWTNNIVWGSSLIGFFNGQDIIWGTYDSQDNIIWGTATDDNIVWGTNFLKTVQSLALLGVF